MARPKGYADWSPTPEVQAVLGQVQSVLEEYRNYLPMTARQVFYRMVGRYGFEKTERAYKRLSGYLVRARRAQLIPFSAIRDDGTIWYPCHGFSESGYVRVRAVKDTASYLDQLHSSADAYRRDLMDAQEMRVEAWCEAGGMAPQLARVCDDYGIEVYSTGGFSSVTVTKEIANRALTDKPTHLLHIGDYDPSGESLYTVMVEDARTFVLQVRRGKGYPDADIRPTRVALTPEQIEEHSIPTAPPKLSDSRSVNWLGETAQAEAMPPDLLADTLRAAVENMLDMDLMEETRQEEQDEREQLRQKLEAFEW